MRRWFVLLLIVLLPLRGWAGASLMADMPMHGAAAMESTVAQPGAAAESAVAMAHDDCAGHAEQAPSQEPPVDDCATCAFCQVCSTVAILIPQPAVAASSPAPGSPSAPATHFGSADTPSAFKPPIS